MSILQSSTADQTFGVVDLFAGPGGLAEGFSSLSVDGTRPFKVQLSIEMDKAAHETLLLRTFLREFEGGFPDEYYDWLNQNSEEPNWPDLYPAEFARASQIAQCLELGNVSDAPAIRARIGAIRKKFGNNTILIGGPPCQAYSLVGRARNGGTAGYDAAADKRHFLYEAYIDVLAKLKPAAFVMENVKGILSSTVAGEAIFRRVLSDLAAQDYRLIAVQPHGIIKTNPGPRDFVVRAEDHGLPQARHRVVVLGIRKDIELPQEDIWSLGVSAGKTSSLRDVLGGMPSLRSGISSGDDDHPTWRNAVLGAAELLDNFRLEDRDDNERFRSGLLRLKDRVRSGRRLSRTSRGSGNFRSSCPEELERWIADPHLRSLVHHETRGHMISDLGRYLFASLFAQATGRSPKASEFPRQLTPNHANWHSGKFADRFRAQVWDRPATTITSHIAKDGHYFIHPDPCQCRSLTVREAARLQTFPDNYIFKGNRTQQYIQVGNAVPPLLAHRIAHVLLHILRGRLLSGDADIDNAA